MCDPLITENANPPFPRPTATCVSVPPLPTRGPRVTLGALGHQVPDSRVSTPTPCRDPRVIKLTALHSAKLHRRAPSPGGDPLGKLFLHCEHFAEGRLPSGSALPVSFNLLIISAKAYWEQFWVNLNLSSLYSAEPLISTKKNTVSF